MQVAVAPLPLSESFLAERVVGVDLEESQAVFEALRDGGALDGAGFLTSDPRWGLCLRCPLAVLGFVPLKLVAINDSTALLRGCGRCHSQRAVL